MNSQELIKSLANYLGVETEDIVPSSFNPNLFVVNGSDEWLVYETQRDAEDAAVEQEKQLLKSEGISIIDWDCISADTDDFVDVSWFDKAKRESYERYVEDIRDEWADDEKTRLDAEMEDAGCVDEDEFIDHLCDGWDNSVEWFKFNFGNSELDEVVRNNPEVVDLDKLAEYIVDSDGVSQVLASYDGEEVDLGDCYAYRVN